jgi:hypothetical protein
MRVIVCAALLSSFFTCIAGCGPGGPDIASVTGKVTLDGQPLVNATVVFMPKSGGRPAAARTDENGVYNLNFSAGRKGTIPGPNRVRITTLSDPYEDDDGNRVPGSRERIPMEYNQQTKLEFDVIDGQKNEANFDLKSAGRIASNTDYGDENN